MKEHELTDEQIKICKNNPLRWEKLSAEIQGCFKIFKKTDLQSFNYCDSVFEDHQYQLIGGCEAYIHRLKADYQRPEPPQVEQWGEWQKCQIEEAVQSISPDTTISSFKDVKVRFLNPEYKGE